jgi:hypothetical protein
MSVNREALKNFLKENGCQDPEGALAPLEKLFQIAESGQYPLAPVEEIYREALIEVVASATGRPASKIVLISLSDHFLNFPKPDWMDQGVYEKSFGDSLVINLEVSFGYSLRDSLWGFGNSLGDILQVTLEIALEVNLGKNLRDNFIDSPSDRFKGILWDNLDVSIFYYLGFCLLNDQQQIAKLRPLVELWSKCLILGFKKDEPETLLVICE